MELRTASLEEEDLTTLLEINQALAEDIHLPSLLNRILECADRLTHSEGSSILLYDEIRRSLYFAHATGPAADYLLEHWGRFGDLEVPLEGSMAGMVFTTGESQLIESVEESRSHFKEVDKDTNLTTTSMLCVPLTVGGKRIGVVQSMNTQGRRYTQRDLEVLKHFAAQAAIGIRNAKLFEDLLAHMGLYATDDGKNPLDVMEEFSRPAHTEKLSILFADMRGFTQFCNMISDPERTQLFLNQYLTMLANCVIDQRGFVNKFLGDGILALFRDERHAERALLCAGAMIDGFKNLKASWDHQTNAPVDFIDIGVGIATDTVIIGPIVAGRVRDFTVVGIAVNLAAHLMESARDGRRILIDKMTYLATKHLSTLYDGPEAFELKKSDEAFGRPFERYCVTLAGDADADVTEPEAPALPVEEEPGIFVSYSHRDREWLEKLQVHLMPYLRKGMVAVWDDTRIKPGERWQEAIQTALASSKVAVLLVSPHFLGSEFIANNELPPLLAAAEEKGVRILWVPLSASSYDETPIGVYQAVIDPQRPIDVMPLPEQNAALVRVCKQIKGAIVA